MRYLKYDIATHQARLILGDPQAEAYEWIQAYVKNLNSHADDEYNYPLTFEELVQTALENVSRDGRDWLTYLVKGELLKGKSVDPMFWDKLAIMTESDVPNNRRENFFSCSC